MLRLSDGRKAAEQGHADAQNNAAIASWFDENKWYNSKEPEMESYADAMGDHYKRMHNGECGLPLLEYARKEVEKRFPITEKLLRQTSAMSRYKLGRWYAEGKDYAQAVKWFRLAAEQGYARAQFSLGVAYDNGKGVTMNYVEAAKWYGKAAVQGHAGAQCYLGVMYHSGQGLPRNDIQAATWFRRAGEQGHAVAQSNLGVMYQTGRGVPQDDAEAAKWYDMAAEHGDATAQHNLAWTSQWVPQDHLQAVKWYRKAGGYQIPLFPWVNISSARKGSHR